MKQAASTIARCAVFAFAGLAAASPAFGQDGYYANKTIRVIVGLEAGGTVDRAAPVHGKA